MTSILVVGSVAYDTVETPFGRAERVLGGSASFFSLAASFFVPVNLVAVVGTDFAQEHVDRLAAHNIDMEGLQRADGLSFFWEGRYSFDLNARETVRTDLNVFQSFRPRIPEKYRHSSHVFLGNIDPVLQQEVLDQVERPRLVALDTMNFWIEGRLDELKKALRRVKAAKVGGRYRFAGFLSRCTLIPIEDLVKTGDEQPAATSEAPADA